MFRAIRLRKLRFRALPWKAIGVIPDEEIWNRILILATWMDLFGEVSVFRSAVPVCHASAGLKVSFGRLGMRRPKSIIDRVWVIQPRRASLRSESTYVTYGR